MKKNYVILLVIILIILGLLFFVKDKKEESDISDPINNSNELINVSENQEEQSDSCLKMQGYEFCTPAGFECEGGFLNGYRYADAVCNIPGRNDFQIMVDAGLASTGYAGSISESMIGVRSFEFTNGQYGVSVCQLHNSEALDLGAEYWLCQYPKDGNTVMTLGIGNSFYVNTTPVGRWFEAHLIISENKEGASDEDYIEILERLVNEGIKIDWSYFTPEDN